MSARSLLIAALAVPLAPATEATGQAMSAETIFYMTGSEASFESFRAHAEHISVIAPQVFAVEGDGLVRGGVDGRVLRLAVENGIRVMPLLVNPGFNQETVHALLHDPEARARAVEAMVDLGRRDGFWGWQFDLENVHIDDRDHLTAFYREAAEALHDAGMSLSIAVVPFSGITGPTPWHAYMHANWRGSFDVAELARIGDFISLMTYS